MSYQAYVYAMNPLSVNRVHIQGLAQTSGRTVWGGSPSLTSEQTWDQLCITNQANLLIACFPFNKFLRRPLAKQNPNAVDGNINLASSLSHAVLSCCSPNTLLCLFLYFASIPLYFYLYEFCKQRLKMWGREQIKSLRIGLWLEITA